MYVAADCTQAYAATKLESWIRQIVFLRPGTFVILDRVVSAKPEYKRTWLLHSRFEPKIDGRTFGIANGAGHQTPVEARGGGENGRVRVGVCPGNREAL
jgi:hypothetical protein